MPMAITSQELIAALRATAERLERGARYEWGHMGRCNCGHLVQTITKMTDREIVASIDYEMDEWTEHAKCYCEGTGGKVDDLFALLADLGFTHQDVIHLENLSDQSIVARIDKRRRPLRRNDVSDVTLYLRTMADVLDHRTAL
ncbi:hypothetical protein Pan216_35000 [Planctomycetes bacterium Pan216]|uniref:Uncharacterized protein n=1 Tax=Kolteria novifilia TaxID=2527975 RepID=A0A518B6M7_9BACT|nr:hypothetical protein Pan216_35000 [Planctomycetes bacterium Pan216]